MTAAFSTETFIAIYQTARRYISENSDPYDNKWFAQYWMLLDSQQLLNRPVNSLVRVKVKAVP